MNGRATAPMAGTLLTPLANGFGSAFAIDEHVSAAVTPTPTESIETTVDGVSDTPAWVEPLSKACIARCTDQFGDADQKGARITLEADLPLDVGLYTPASAANAIVLATLQALKIPVVDDWHDDSTYKSKPVSEQSPVTCFDLAKLVFDATMEADVTDLVGLEGITASMYGGLTVTDSIEQTLLQHEPVEWDVVMWTPGPSLFGETTVEKCKHVSKMADQVLELIQKERYSVAMMLNGFAFGSALGVSLEPIVEAMPNGATLSGTGPSYIAIGESSSLDEIRQYWELREGVVRETTATLTGAWIGETP